MTAFSAGHNNSSLRQSGTSDSGPVAVVAGLVVLEGRLLVCQRDPRGVFPLKWEFPGGKVESGEAAAHALRRELKEELNIEVGEAHEIFRHRHNYSDHAPVDLRFFHVVSFSGSPENRLFNDMLWIRPEELQRFDFLEADLPLIERIRQGSLRLDPSRRVARPEME